MRKLLFIFCVFLSGLSFAQPLIIQEPVRYLALGDAYTVGEGVDFSERWSEQLFDSLEVLGFETDTIHYIAQTGWKTNDLLAAIDQAAPDSNYNLVSLLIGVNNQFQGQGVSDRYASEFPDLLNRAIALAGGDRTKVIVLSIPDYRFTPFGQRSKNPQANSIALDKYNSTARAICDTAGIHFFDIASISRRGLLDSTLVATDGRHPSAKQYSLWANAVLSQGVLLTSTKREVDAVYVFQGPVKKGQHLFQFDNVMKWDLIVASSREVITGWGDFKIPSDIRTGTYLARVYRDADHYALYKFEVID